MFLALFLVDSCFAQSPPLGPPDIHVDNYDIGVGLLTGIVTVQVQQSIDATNASLENQKQGARVSALPLQFWTPYRTPTQYTDRPNQWYVTLPVTVGVQVHIPDWFDRQVYVPLNLNVSCEGWYTGSGVIQVDAVAGQPNFEGGSWLEDAPGLSLIRDAVNNAVRSNFNVPPATSTTFSQLKCNALGVLPGQTPTDKLAAIIYGKPPAAGPTHHPAGVELLEPALTVTFVGLKRLVARDLKNNILYSATENIVLETYADYTVHASPVLSMRENDQVPLTITPVVFQPPFLDPLVILANIQQEQTSVEDSAFAIWPKSLNFSPGTHTLTVTKTYTLPPGTFLGQTKPQFNYVPAYELTYTVQYRGSPEVFSPAK